MLYFVGGGGTQNSEGNHSANLPIPGMGGIVQERPLLDMALLGEDGVPLSVAVKIVKLSYCYEQWDTMEVLLGNTLAALKVRHQLYITVVK